MIESTLSIKVNRALCGFDQISSLYLIFEFYIIVGLELYLSTNDRVFQRPRFSSIVRNEKELWKEGRRRRMRRGNGEMKGVYYGEEVEEG